MPWDRLKVRWIDAAGFCLVLCALVAAVWLTQLNPGSARAALAELRGREFELQTEHSRLQRSGERSETIRRRQLEEARREGLLRGSSRINDRLRSVRELAAQHGWEEVQILPLYETETAHFVEKRFSLTASAKFKDVLALLADFERSPRSAGISHISLKPMQGNAGHRARPRSVTMTLDFYADMGRAWSDVATDQGAGP